MGTLGTMAMDPLRELIDHLPAAELLLLLACANGTPILLRDLLGKRAALPLDLGYRTGAGHPWLGRSKTWRGLGGSLLVTAGVAWLLGLSPLLGLQVAALAMGGDLASSFVKRRLGIPPSGRAPLLDQLPESLLPAWCLGPRLGLGGLEIGLVAVLFTAGEMLLSPLLYRLHIRRRPY